MMHAKTPAGARNTSGRKQIGSSTRLRPIVAFDAQMVKTATDIIAVVSEYVPLRRMGAAGRYVGLCPFHQEKTPSFNVNQHHQSYKCFGCGSSGDVFSFLMTIDGLSFGDAVKVLGERLGMSGRHWTEAEKQGYARAAAHAPTLARRLADFAHGLDLATDRQLTKLSDALETVGIDSSETLSHLHRARYLLTIVKPQDIAATFAAMAHSAPNASKGVEALGREDREHSEVITSLIVELVTASQRAGAGA